MRGRNWKYPIILGKRNIKLAHELFFLSICLKLRIAFMRKAVILVATKGTDQCSEHFTEEVRWTITHLLNCHQPWLVRNTWSFWVQNLMSLQSKLAHFVSTGLSACLSCLYLSKNKCIWFIAFFIWQQGVNICLFSAVINARKTLSLI